MDVLKEKKSKFQINDSILVPVSKIASKYPELNSHPFVYLNTKVKRIEDKSIVFDYNFKHGIEEIKIGSSVCYKDVGILVLNISDFESETALFEPLTKSVLQYCRLLFEDSYIKQYKIRTIAELERLWERDHRFYTHIVIIGHGSKKGFFFNGEAESSQKLKQIFDAPVDLRKKVFISLCCETGNSSVAEEFSKIKACSHFIAPINSIHGVTASLFLQTLFTHHFLHGKGINVSCKNTLKLMKGLTSFRVWKDGKFSDSTHTKK